MRSGSRRWASPYPFRLVGYVIAGAFGGVAGFLLCKRDGVRLARHPVLAAIGELLFMVILGRVRRL